MRNSNPKTIHLDYQDSNKKVDQCREKANQFSYEAAESLLINAKNARECEEAERRFQAICNYSDSSKKIEECQAKARQLSYSLALRILMSASNENDYREAAERFSEIADYKDSQEKASESFLKLSEVSKKGITSRKVEKGAWSAPEVRSCRGR